MILVDTNVLVALVDERDALRRRAERDLAKAKGRTLRTTRVVLTETLFLLSKVYQRKRLRFLLGALPILELEGELAPLEAILEWIRVVRRTLSGLRRRRAHGAHRASRRIERMDVRS